MATAYRFHTPLVAFYEIFNELNGNSFSTITNVITEAPTGSKPQLFRVNGNDIIVNENLTIPRWSIGIYIPYSGDGVIICVNTFGVTCAYRSGLVWVISYTLK